MLLQMESFDIGQEQTRNDKAEPCGCERDSLAHAGSREDAMETPTGARGRERPAGGEPRARAFVGVRWGTQATTREVSPVTRSHTGRTRRGLMADAILTRLHLLPGKVLTVCS